MKMNINKLLNYIIFGSLFLIVLYLFIDRNIKANEYQYNFKEKVSYNRKLEFLKDEMKIRLNTMGSKFDREFNKILTQNNIDYKKHKKAKIFVFIDKATCSPCYKEVSSFISKQITNKKYKTELYLLIQTQNSNFVKYVNDGLADTKVEILKDEEFSFERYGLSDNKYSVIMGLDKSNVCRYSFITKVGEEKHLKRNFKILINSLNDY